MTIIPGNPFRQLSPPPRVHCPSSTLESAGAGAPGDSLGRVQRAACSVQGFDG